MSDETDMTLLYQLIRGRQNIQNAAHELLWLVKGVRTGKIRDTGAAAKIELLVAVTFSLWRAIFLADGERDWDAISANAETFLVRLIRHNSITYADDWNSRNWSFLYYLENARLRLKQMADTWPDERWFDGHDADWLHRSAIGTSPGQDAGRNSMILWEQVCMISQTMIWRLKDEMERDAR